MSFRETILIQSIDFCENFTNLIIFDYLNSIIKEEKNK